MPSTNTVDVLLNLVPDRPDAVLEHLASNRSLACGQDCNGYSLLHAAVSYNHADLARRLVGDYQVPVDLKDNDGDTALCVAETVDMARLLVEELRADPHSRNHSGETPDEKIDAEEDYPLVAAYLRHVVARGDSSSEAVGGRTADGSNPPPRVPPGINDVRIATTQVVDDDDSSAPDPEIRRRIEELAAREDFQSERGQADLRNLVTEVVSGLRSEQQQQEGEGERPTRRRID